MILPFIVQKILIKHYTVFDHSYYELVVMYIETSTSNMTGFRKFYFYYKFVKIVVFLIFYIL